jgi:hypothetical protein
MKFLFLKLFVTIFGLDYVIKLKFGYKTEDDLPDHLPHKIEKNPQLHETCCRFNEHGITR